MSTIRQEAERMLTDCLQSVEAGNKYISISEGVVVRIRDLQIICNHLLSIPEAQGQTEELKPFTELKEEFDNLITTPTGKLLTHLGWFCQGWWNCQKSQTAQSPDTRYDALVKELESKLRYTSIGKDDDGKYIWLQYVDQSDIQQAIEKTGGIK